jgi:hypothetical protein
VVRGQDVGCGFGSWQYDLLGVPEAAFIGHAIGGANGCDAHEHQCHHEMPAVLVSGVDVANRILVGSILRAPTDRGTRTFVTSSARGRIEIAGPDVLTA